jgi:hypothetical protein
LNLFRGFDLSKHGIREREVGVGVGFQVTSDNLYDRMEGIPFRSYCLSSDVHEIFIHRNMDGIILRLNTRKTSSRRMFIPEEMPIKGVLTDMDI